MHSYFSSKMPEPVQLYPGFSMWSVSDENIYTLYLNVLLTWKPIRFQFSKTSAACEMDTDQESSGSLFSWMSNTEHLYVCLKIYKTESMFNQVH